jgi:hypothetical protein
MANSSSSTPRTLAQIQADREALRRKKAPFMLKPRVLLLLLVVVVGLVAFQWSKGLAVIQQAMCARCCCCWRLRGWWWWCCCCC